MLWICKWWFKCNKINCLTSSGMAQRLRNPMIYLHQNAVIFVAQFSHDFHYFDIITFGVPKQRFRWIRVLTFGAWTNDKRRTKRMLWSTENYMSWKMETIKSVHPFDGKCSGNNIETLQKITGMFAWMSYFMPFLPINRHVKWSVDVYENWKTLCWLLNSCFNIFKSDFSIMLPAILPHTYTHKWKLFSLCVKLFNASKKKFDLFRGLKINLPLDNKIDCLWKCRMFFLLKSMTHNTVYTIMLRYSIQQVKFQNWIHKQSTLCEHRRVMLICICVHFVQ